MSGLPFDTLKLARGLRDQGGFSQQQAEGFAEALAEAMPGNLLTKADLAAFESRLSGASRRMFLNLDSRFRGIRWMLVATLVLEVATFIKVFAR